MEELKAAVDSLAAGGFTNHAEAFAKATALFDPNSTNAKLMVMFTDGKTTAGPDPNPVAAAARADGVIIYCIGLIGANGIDPAVLDEWATDPSETHVALAIALSEVDQQGNEYQRGTKTLTIPAHFSTSCRDVLVTTKRALPAGSALTFLSFGFVIRRPVQSAGKAAESRAGSAADRNQMRENRGGLLFAVLHLVLDSRYIGDHRPIVQRPCIARDRAARERFSVRIGKVQAVRCAVRAVRFAERFDKHLLKLRKVESVRAYMEAECQAILYHLLSHAG